MVIELCVIQFWSEIILTISDIDFEITCTDFRPQNCTPPSYISIINPFIFLICLRKETFILLFFIYREHYSISYIIEVDVFENVVGTGTCRDRTANVHTVFKATGPERHPVEDDN